MIRNCPVCGKAFDVLWPHLWTFKRGGTFICSFGCMRRIDKGEGNIMERKITEEMKQEAVRIALEGGEYCRYLRECGSLNPSAHWAPIKKKLMKEDPETYEKLAKLTGRKKQVETPEGEYANVKVTGPIRIQTETPEKVKVETPESCVKGPVTPEELMEFGKDGWKELPKVTDGKKNFGLPAYIEGFEITGLLGQFGTYRASHEHNYFEFDPFGGDLCMNPQDWREQLEELHHAAKLLGVEL